MPEVLRSWTVSNARVAVYRAERGVEMTRETCPHTQIWLMLDGTWRERGDDRRRVLEPFDIHRYAPTEPCRRIVESDSQAVSIEVFANTGQGPLSVDQTLGVWTVARAAIAGDLDQLGLEETVAGWIEVDSGGSTHSAWLESAMEIVRAEYREPLTLESVASRVGVTPNHLSARFKATYGVSVSKFIRRLRLNDALRNFHQSGASWLDAGFYDAGHFWRACKADLGFKPSEIRKMLS